VAGIATVEWRVYSAVFVLPAAAAAAAAAADGD